MAKLGKLRIEVTYEAGGPPNSTMRIVHEPSGKEATTALGCACGSPDVRMVRLVVALQRVYAVCYACEGVELLLRLSSREAPRGQEA